MQKQARVAREWELCQWGQLGTHGHPCRLATVSIFVHIASALRADLLLTVTVMQLLGSIEILHMRGVLTKLSTVTIYCSKVLSTRCCFDHAHHRTGSGLLVQRCDLPVLGYMGERIFLLIKTWLGLQICMKGGAR